MISALELCLQGLGREELEERTSGLASLIESGTAIVAKNSDTFAIVAAPPVPEFPWLAPGLA
jgi:hypothetical protein